MKLAHDLSGAGIAGADRTPKRLGAVAQLLQVGITGKTAGWHVGLLSDLPDVRCSGQKGDSPNEHNTASQVGLALSADRMRPARNPDLRGSETLRPPEASAGRPLPFASIERVAA